MEGGGAFQGVPAASRKQKGRGKHGTRGRHCWINLLPPAVKAVNAATLAHPWSCSSRF
jgi:hypothetical protein